MQLGRWPVLLGLALLIEADDAAACSLALSTGGTLALSGDATRLASTEPGGVGATFTVLNLSLGAATVTVSAPQWVSLSSRVQCRCRGAGGRLCRQR